MKQTLPTKRKQIRRDWYKIDLKEKILGRISTEIALKLMGKSKPYFVSHLDCGDYVVVTNAKKIRVTGNKVKQKTYMKYSGYPAGLKTKTYAQVSIENPIRIIREAVSGMLPNNKLKKSMLKRLYIYETEENPYESKFKK